MISRAAARPFPSLVRSSTWETTPLSDSESWARIWSC